MKRVADAREPPVVIPVIVVAVDVHVTLVVPPVERGELYKMPSLPLPVECSLSCIEFAIVIAWHSVPSIFFFEVLHAPRYLKP